MDNRTKQTKDIKSLLYFIAGVFICGIGIKLDAYLKLPTWESKQAKIINTLELKSPLQQLMIQPVEAKEATPQATVSPQKKDNVEVGQVDTEIIRMLESSKGTAGLALTCKSKGLSNEYGYLGKKDTGHCYESHEILTMIVKNWFNRRLREMSVSESLCLYNTGVKQTNCEYSQNYFKLL